jgi:ketosteroid isomerase-like protein
MVGAHSFGERLVGATNRHDLDGLVACFAEDYENQTPVHPARGFRGRGQVRRNWEEIFAVVPDIRVELLASAIDGETAWTELDMSGTRADGTPLHMRGVVIFGVGDGVAQWARFYVEPVDESSGTVDDARRQQVVRE